MDAKGTASAHHIIKNLRCLRGNRVVLNKEYLEFIHDQENAWQHLAGFLPVFGQGCNFLRTLFLGFVEEVSSMLDFFTQSLKDTQAKFPLALNSNDTYMRQLGIGVSLELYALFEINQVEFNLARIVGQSYASNKRM